MATSQPLWQIALALLLPLYIRSTNPTEFVYVVSITKIMAMAFVYFGTKPLRFDMVKAVVIAASWSWLANRLADYVVWGEWKRLLLAYCIALDGMWLLFPVDAVAAYTNYMARVQDSSYGPAMILISVSMAALVTRFLDINGALISHGPVVHSTASAAVVFLLLAVTTKHLTVAMLRSFGTRIPGNFITEVSENADLPLGTGDQGDPHAACPEQDQGTVKKRCSHDWEAMTQAEAQRLADVMLGNIELGALDEEMGSGTPPRASTRRRG
ncbi:hypothetical protein BDV95DRAFT_44419 [Massariosphaeria phaeospora]|uniref:Uncharacterized protein n=1 Tax=Massariosphaeria phaeospora TaxID=100035 RepID=A0A7C8I7Y8_9PLEO|nr:hypothetical protein BDV95DRAFT_44419 [Massariosphaeria phaeospora]